jgi:hypothetical protein
MKGVGGKIPNPKSNSKSQIKQTEIPNPKTQKYGPLDPPDVLDRLR